ncbi:MAG: hypothetical protein U0746_02255 [Gemmataceae bacterium]
MSDRPSFVDLGESDTIAALLAELDAPAADVDSPQVDESIAHAQVVSAIEPLSFAERPPRLDVPPPLPLPDEFEAIADSPLPSSRPAGATLAAIPWHNPAPPAPEPPPAEPERILAPWLHDEPPILTKPVPTGRFRVCELLTSINWRNDAKPPSLPTRLESLIPPPPKPGLFEDPDADAGQRRGRQLSVAEIMGQFAFD